MASDEQSERAEYRKILWIALIVNAAMCVVEISSGLVSGSVSLLADAIDFFGDAANYGLSIAVLGSPLLMRNRVALFKAACMFAFGAFVLSRAAWSAQQGITPEPVTMGLIGALALCANLLVAYLLYRFREGDANMRSVWLCTRNDALSNIAVMCAALGVLGTQSKWPDLIVAAIMGGLALSSVWAIARGSLAKQT
jgi:Co/Zn/Cd efflux system component